MAWVEMATATAAACAWNAAGLMWGAALRPPPARAAVRLALLLPATAWMGLLMCIGVVGWLKHALHAEDCAAVAVFGGVYLAALIGLLLAPFWRRPEDPLASPASNPAANPAADPAAAPEPASAAPTVPPSVRGPLSRRGRWMRYGLMVGALAFLAAHLQLLNRADNTAAAAVDVREKQLYALLPPPSPLPGAATVVAMVGDNEIREFPDLMNNFYQADDYNDTRGWEKRADTFLARLNAGEAALDMVDPGEGVGSANHAPESLAAFVERHRPQMEIVRRLARNPARMAGLDFRVPYARSWNGYPVSELAKLVLLEGLYACATDDRELAARDIATLLDLERCLSQMPHLIGRYYPMGLSGKIFQLTRAYLGRPQLTAADLARLPDLTPANNYRRQLDGALDFEAHFIVAQLRNMRTQPLPVLMELGVPQIPGTRWYVGLWSRAFCIPRLAHGLDAMFVDLHRAAVAPSAELAAQARLENAKRQAAADETILEAILRPALESSLLWAARCDQQRVVLLAAVAVAKYRLAHQATPTDWEALIPADLSAAPFDDFAGGPLQLRSDDARLWVYSVGTDGVDHFGVSLPDLSDDVGSDIAVTLLLEN